MGDLVLFQVSSPIRPICIVVDREGKQYSIPEAVYRVGNEVYRQIQFTLESDHEEISFMMSTSKPSFSQFQCRITCGGGLICESDTQLWMGARSGLVGQIVKLDGYHSHRLVDLTSSLNQPTALLNGLRSL